MLWYTKSGLTTSFFDYAKDMKGPPTELVVTYLFNSNDRRLVGDGPVDHRVQDSGRTSIHSQVGPEKSNSISLKNAL